MDKIFVNGSIQTLDNAGRVYQAVGVRHGRIEALGVEDEVRRMTSSRTEIIDLKGAVLRRTQSGEILGPDEALTMDEALKMFTYGSAYLAFEEKIAGTIEVGKRADFTVLAADPREVPIEEVPDIPVKMTVVEGEIMFDESGGR